MANYLSLPRCRRCARPSVQRLRCAAAAKMRAQCVCIISPLFTFNMFNFSLQVSARACATLPPALLLFFLSSNRLPHSNSLLYPPSQSLLHAAPALHCLAAPSLSALYALSALAPPSAAPWLGERRAGGAQPLPPALLFSLLSSPSFPLFFL